MKTPPHEPKETILLVEDDAAVRLLTKAVLARKGYQVLEAANGMEALWVWSGHHAPIHLLLTDMVMPHGMTGRELAVELQQRNPQLKVIFTSGYSAELASGEMKLQEGENFLPKPWAPQQLLEVVRRCLDH
jgi:two-component system, cell cycle sensor histidine kinase and response regulator CckA